MEGWTELADRLKRDQMEFVIEPYIRFKGERASSPHFILRDRSVNALEFEAFKDIESQLFAT